MQAKTVIELLTLFAENDIDVIIDGGWGVDALLGSQTRPHKDLDIAISHRGVPKLRQLLAEKGFSDVSALCQYFDIHLPKEYDKFLKKNQQN